MMMTRTLVAAMAALALAACGGAGVPDPAQAGAPALQQQPRQTRATVSLYLPAGSVQCQGNEGGLDAVEDSLAQSGVHPSSLACGHDGRLRAQVCGEPDGRIFMVDVTPAEESAAKGLGYLPLDGLPEAQRQPC